MGDPYFDAIRQGGQAYADTQLKADPYYALAQGFQAAPREANFSNPWANVGIALAAPVLGGMTAGKAQNNYQNNLNAGLGALVNYAGLGTPVPAGMESYAQQVDLGRAQVLQDQMLKDEDLRKNFNAQAQLKAAEWEANEGSRLRALNLPAINPFGGLFQQPNLAGTQQGAYQRQPQQVGALPPPQQAPVSTSPDAVAVINQPGGAASNPVPVAVAPVVRSDGRLDPLTALRQVGGNEKTAALMLEHQNAPIEKQELKREKDLEKADTILQEKRQASAETGALLQELASAYERAGKTGGVIPLVQTLREAALKGKAATYSTDAGKKLGAMKDLETLSLDMAGQIRKMFPGPVAIAEMKMYLSAAVNQNNTPEQNKAIIEKLARAKLAGDLSMDFIQQRIDEGKSYPQAEREYLEFDRKVPLFVRGPGGEREINPQRLGMAGTTPPNNTPANVPFSNQGQPTATPPQIIRNSSGQEFQVDTATKRLIPVIR